MHTIDIYGFAQKEICSGCEGECGSGTCAPGGKRPTIELVREFSALMAVSHPGISVSFVEATDEGIARHEDVQKLLSMADLAPVTVMDGKVLFLGGFSPEGLRVEISKRL